MYEGAVLRVRPVAMTVAVIIARLIPIMWSGGTGGMITAPFLSMFVIPAAYYLMRRRSLKDRQVNAPAPQPL